MKRILIAHPGLGSGGSEARALVLIASLQKEHHVTLLSGAPFESVRLNAAYQTEVDPDRIAFELAPMPQWLRHSQAGDAIRGAYLSRRIRQISSRFDVCISAYNFSPFGRPAIHFLADFSWDQDYRLAHDPPSGGLRGLIQRPGPLHRIYSAATRAVAGNDVQPLPAPGDIVVANSRWSADLLQSRHGIASRVIYPPVNAAPFAADAPRTPDFVLLGRISPDKRIEEAIETLARVRAIGHEFNFHIIGALDASPYSVRLRSIAQRHSAWVRLRGGIYGTEKFAELARHSYAIHMRAREPFGIAVAEQLKMGLIPFVPADTAPAEIVGDPRLCFHNAEQAVDLIDRVLQSPQDHGPIRASLAARGQMFSKERFVKEARELVSEALASGRNGS